MLEIMKAVLANAEDLGFVHATSWKQAYRGIVPQTFLDQLTSESRATFFRKAISISQHEFYGAYLKGKPVGMMSIGHSRDKDASEDTAEISAIYCIADVWGTGCGRQLMDFAVNHLKKHAYHTISLWVFEENRRARKFYEKYGYTFDGTKEQSDISGKQLTEMRYIYQL